MPFKFKLSKRLALMKALLAASAGLALACDRADLTSPQSLSRPLADVIVTSPSPISVVASTDDGSNVPSNTLDNSLATRWSARGDGQWIRYDLGTIVTMDHVDIAWYVGDTRSTYFDIEVSSDTVIWTMVFSGQSSGQTLQFERYDFPATAGRYLRIVGHGNSLLTGWISITEVTISQAAASVATASLPVSSVVASASDSTVPQNTRDEPAGRRRGTVSGSATTWAGSRPSSTWTSPGTWATPAARTSTSRCRSILLPGRLFFPDAAVGKRSSSSTTHSRGRVPILSVSWATGTA